MSKATPIQGFVTAQRLMRVTGYSTETLYRDRIAGLLARGERRRGVRGLIVTMKQAKDYLRSKGKQHLIEKL